MLQDSVVNGFYAAGAENLKVGGGQARTFTVGIGEKAIEIVAVVVSTFTNWAEQESFEQLTDCFLIQSHALAGQSDWTDVQHCFGTVRHGMWSLISLHLGESVHAEVSTSLSCGLG